MDAEEVERRAHEILDKIRPSEETDLKIELFCQLKDIITKDPILEPGDRIVKRHEKAEFYIHAAHDDPGKVEVDFGPGSVVLDREFFFKSIENFKHNDQLNAELRKLTSLGTSSKQ